MEVHRIGGYPHIKLVEALNMAISALRSQADTPPNDPLTLDELREMDGEPVWIQHLGENKDSRWRIIKYSTDAGLHVKDSYPALYYGWDTYGWLWNAYRRKPEEG